MNELRKLIQDEYGKGNIVINTIEGLRAMKLDGLINQCADGLLYDLNRNEGTVVALIDDPKWINDYACAKVIRALKQRIDELEKQLNENDEQ